MRKSRLTRRTPLERQPMTRRAACDCTHERSEHTPDGGACLVCACTWYHPNVRSVRRKKRSAAEQREKFEREYGGEAKRAFVASLPCIVPGCPGTPCENAHVVTIDGGMSRKGHHSGNAPMCFTHHRGGKHSLHELGSRTFERLHGLDLAECARLTDAAWRQHSGLTPLSQIVPGVVRAIVEGGA